MSASNGAKKKFKQRMHFFENETKTSFLNSLACECDMTCVCVVVPGVCGIGYVLLRLTVCM